MSLLLDGTEKARPGARAQALRARFDGTAAESICEIAAGVCGVPSAGMNLVIEGETPRSVWYGTAPPLVALQQTPCARVIAEGRPLVLRDLSDGGTFKLGAARAYAGTPIVGMEGQVFGSLCVLDTVSRDFSPRQMRCLATLAGQVAGGLNCCVTSVRPTRWLVIASTRT